MIPQEVLTRSQIDDQLRDDAEVLFQLHLSALKAENEMFEVMNSLVKKLNQPVNESNVSTIGNELLDAYQSCMINHFVFTFPEICGSVDTIMQKSFLTLFEIHKAGNRESTVILSKVLQTKNQSPQHRSNYESLGISAGFPSNEDMLTSITQNQQNPIPL
ncbi:MAG: hypothetical protein EAZ34_06350 [Polaromonas sp.]|nr:MAG: hypothetical protein EAZ34_06350 [Polaromonas sp.]